MGQEARVAIINARVASVLIEMEAMKAANAEREVIGASPAYGEMAFRELLERAAIQENAVIAFLRD